MAEIVHLGNTRIYDGVRMDHLGKLILGPNSVIGYEAWIELHTHDFDTNDWPDVEFPHTLTIGAQVYIGARAMILGGCQLIADGVLIGAGSVVTKNISIPWTKWAGNPARYIGDRKRVNTRL